MDSEMNECMRDKNKGTSTEREGERKIHPPRDHHGGLSRRPLRVKPPIFHRSSSCGRKVKHNDRNKYSKSQRDIYVGTVATAHENRHRYMPTPVCFAPCVICAHTSCGTGCKLNTWYKFVTSSSAHGSKSELTMDPKHRFEILSTWKDAFPTDLVLIPVCSAEIQPCRKFIAGRLWYS